MNTYIEKWKTTISIVLYSNKFLYIFNKKEYDPSNDIREMASKQLKLLDEYKKEPNKSLYSQCNKQQKEFIDYLEKVILYGNIEAKDNIKNV